MLYRSRLFTTTASPRNLNCTKSYKPVGILRPSGVRFIDLMYELSSTPIRNSVAPEFQSSMALFPIIFFFFFHLLIFPVVGVGATDFLIGKRAELHPHAISGAVRGHVALGSPSRNS